MNRIVARRRPVFACLVVVGLAFPAAGQAPPAKPADQKAEFFKANKVYAIEVVFGEKELQSLRQEPRKYVKAKVTEDGKTVYADVAVHIRGAAGSTRGVDDKPGLTLNMDKFVDGQRFHGMDKWHLTNSVQDPSYLTEILCGEIYRAAGIPASRFGHALVTINGRKRGLYCIKEGYDKGFLKESFGSADGNFYDGGFLRELDQPLDLISTKNDVKDRADLKAVWEAAKEGDVNKRWQRLEQVLDTERFVTYMAIQSATWDWDGYPMNRNNYRLYHDTNTKKVVFIPSGMDQMYGDPNGPVFPNFQGFVARQAVETPTGRAKYLAKIAELSKTVMKPEVLVRRLDELQAKVQPALKSVDAGAGNDYPNQVNRLKQAIPQRAKSLAEQLKTIKK